MYASRDPSNFGVGDASDAYLVARLPICAPELVELDVEGESLCVKRSTLMLCAESGLAQTTSEEWASEDAGGEPDEEVCCFPLAVKLVVRG